MPKRVQRYPRQVERDQRSRPVSRQLVRIDQITVGRAEHERIVRQAAESEGHTRLKRRLAMLAQDINGPGREGDHTATGFRLWGFDAQSLLDGPFNGALDSQAASIELDVTPLCSDSFI